MEANAAFDTYRNTLHSEKQCLPLGKHFLVYVVWGMGVDMFVFANFNLLYSKDHNFPQALQIKELTLKRHLTTTFSDHKNKIYLSTESPLMLRELILG